MAGEPTSFFHEKSKISVVEGVNQPNNNPKNIAMAINYLGNLPSSQDGNINLASLAFDFYCQTIPFTISEIYFALLRAYSGQGKVVFKTADGITTHEVSLNATNNGYDDRISALGRFFKLFNSSPGCKLEVLKRKTPATKEVNLAENEKSIETIAFTTYSVERGEIKWEVEINVSRAFAYPKEDEIEIEDEEDMVSRTIIVTRIKNDKGERWVQAFYKSSGYNSGYNNMWFPMQGTWGTHLANLGAERLSKEKYHNHKANHYLTPVQLPDGTIQVRLNPQVRLGSFESILINGNVYREISEHLGKMQIMPRKRVSYREINSELRSIDQLVDIDPKEDN